jgi:hypothetical protein
VLHLAADENFNNDLLRGIRRRNPDVDVVRVQDAGLSGADDATVLAWAAGEGRVLLTHDVTTLIDTAYQRVVTGLAMPGVFAVQEAAAAAQVIEDLLLLVECSVELEWDGRILYVPM